MKRALATGAERRMTRGIVRGILRIRHGLVLALLPALLAGCAGVPVGSGLPSVWHASPNHDLRRPNFVIIHHTTSGSAEAGLRSLTEPLRRVSAHYLIGRDGTLYQLVDERRRAWHAGASWWGGNRDINSASIGIELDNDGEVAFPEPQIAALLALLDDLRTRYAIPAANVLGHADVAPGRKADPSRQFPWRRLALQGFGLWCDPPYAPPPPGLDTLTALQALGYDVSRPEAAIAAFRLHFEADDGSIAPGAAPDAALLACLVERSRMPRPGSSAPSLPE
ncbi:MAG: N-acetylmuramoyl-L-alanine amidase [Rhodocyclaceae bacterium]|nr:N-acetylmuramoyl-L-alanine amidase [Rhodocyclaceae bacterium]